MNRKDFNDWLRKHAKKLTLGILIGGASPLSATAQNITEKPNIKDSIEVSAQHLTYPEYDANAAPVVETSATKLGQMTAQQAQMNLHKIYVGHFNEDGELEVFRADARCVAAGDVLTGVFRRECGHYTKKYLTRSVTDNVRTDGMSHEEYYNWATSDAHDLGEVIYNYCNFRQKKQNGNTIVVRAGFFQGGINEWSQCLRFAYCTNNENMRSFAAHFIDDDEYNRTLRDSIMAKIYQDGKLIEGEEGVQKRMSVLGALQKIKVHGLSRTVGGRTCFSQEFCDLLQNTATAKKFAVMEEQYRYDAVRKDICQMQEDYVLNFYAIAGRHNRVAENADILAAQNINTVNSRKHSGIAKVTPQQVNQNNATVKTISWADATMFMESIINGGCNYKGIYPEVKSGLQKFLGYYKKNNPCDNILTEKYLHQMSILGISGAKEAYAKFLSLKQQLENEEERIREEKFNRPNRYEIKRDNTNINSLRPQVHPSTVVPKSVKIR